MSDLDKENLRQQLVSHEGLSVACALHIGSVNAVAQAAESVDLSHADFVYPDGYSVWLLARRMGLRNVQRVATTDLWEDVVKGLAKRHHRRVRLAIIGSEQGVAEQAATSARETLPIGETWAHHGFFTDSAPVIQSLRAFQPDLVLVGMGMPLEMQWITRNYDLLPPALYMTCGGMLRLVAGHERRAPALFRRLRIEWLFRMVRFPKRDGRRYLTGFLTLLKALRDAQHK